MKTRTGNKPQGSVLDFRKQFDFLQNRIRKKTRSAVRSIDFTTLPITTTSTQRETGRATYEWAWPTASPTTQEREVEERAWAWPLRVAR